MTQFINSVLGSEVDYLDTGLNALANDGAVLGDAIDNSSDRDMFLKVQIYLPSVNLSAETDPHVQVRLIESIDGGTVYEDNDDKAWSISLPVAATTAIHIRIGELAIPPGNYKLAIVNKTGQAFAGTLNVFSYAVYTPETGA